MAARWWGQARRLGVDRVPVATKGSAFDVEALDEAGPAARACLPGRGTVRSWADGLAPLLSQRFPLLLGGVAGVALVAKLWLSLRTYGTNDVYAFEQFARWARYLGSGLYAAAWDFNHPPAMLPILRDIAHRRPHVRSRTTALVPAASGTPANALAPTMSRL